MGQGMKLSCLLLYAAAAVLSLAACEKGVGKVQKHRLMLEYDWPVPSKNLKRIPHPESCERFYIVKAGGSYFMKNCPANEIFDYRSLQCKQKSMAKCWKDIVDKGRLKKLKRSFSCPFPWGLYPDVEDCSQFFECLGGIHYLRKCPASTVFDKAERTCVPVGKALCADESDVVEPGYKCPYKWGYYAHSTDCSKYYECLRKVPNIRTCGKNMLFDNFRRNCFPMEEVACGKRLNPYEEVTELPKKEIAIEINSNTPESTASENIPTKDDDAHASIQTNVTIFPSENNGTSAELERIVAANLTNETENPKILLPNTTIAPKPISNELEKVAGEDTTDLHDFPVELNVTYINATAKKTYSSKPDEKGITSIPAIKDTITTELEKVSEKTRKNDKTSVEDVPVTPSETSLTNIEAKVVSKKSEEIATTKQN